MRAIVYKRVATIASVLLLSACVSFITPDIETALSELEQGQYSIDKGHSTILFKVDHFGFAMQVGRFNRFDASLDFNPDDITQSRLTAVVSTASVDFNNPSLENTVRGSSWLNSSEYPEAYYETRSAEQIDAQTVRFTGDFTLLGETRPLSLDVTFNGGANNILSGRYTIGFSAVGQLERAEFGMDSYIPAVGNEIFLDINAEFQLNE